MQTPSEQRDGSLIHACIVERVRVTIGWVVAIVVGASAAARADGGLSDPAPVAPTSPPETAPEAAAPMAPPAAGTAAPVAAPVAVVEDETHKRTVDRQGIELLAGVIVVNSTAAWRLDGFVPIPAPKAPRLRVGLSTIFQHDSAAIPELAIEAYSFGVLPSVAYDWRLPMRSSAGDFVVSAQGGLGVFVARVKIDEPFMPGNYESIRTVAMRMAAAGQFRAKAGWIASLQLLGFIVPLGDADAPARYDVHTGPELELAFMGGYQFQ